MTRLAQIRPGSRPLWSAAAGAAEAVVRFGSTADIAGALAALMRVDMLEKPLCDRAMAAVQRTMKSAQPQVGDQTGREGQEGARQAGRLPQPPTPTMLVSACGR